MKGFRDFVLRGNLIELAVAFIVGAAFAAVIAAFTKVILEAIGKITGGADFNFDKWQPGGWSTVGPFLTALIAFLIMAFVVYFFIVKPYEKAKDEVLPGRARRRDDRPEHRAAPRDPRRAARPPRLTAAPEGAGHDTRRWPALRSRMPPRRHSQCGGRCSRSQRSCWVSPGFGSARGGTTSGASSADGLVPGRSARRRTRRRGFVARPDGCSPAPAASRCRRPRPFRPDRPLGRLDGVRAVSHHPGPHAPRPPRGSGTRHGPGRGTRRSTTPAGAASRAARAARRAAGRGRAWCASRRTAARRTPRASTIRPACAGSSTARSTGSADEPTSSCTTSPWPRSRRARSASTTERVPATGAAGTASEVDGAPSAGTPGSGPPAA